MKIIVLIIVVFLVLAFLVFWMLKAIPKGSRYGPILIIIGVVWCAGALISSTSVDNEVVSFELLFSRLGHIIIGCSIALIGSIFTATGYLKKQ